MTTKQSILSYLEGRDWTPGWLIEDQSDYWSSKASTVDRRCRELVNDGRLDRKLVKGGVWYKTRPTKVWLQPRVSVKHLPDNQLFETAPTPKRFEMK